MLLNFENAIKFIENMIRYLNTLIIRFNAIKFQNKFFRMIYS